MDIVRAYVRLKMNKVNIKRTDELLDRLVDRLENEVSNRIVVYNESDFNYCVAKLMEKGNTDILVEECDSAYALYKEEVKENLRIEGVYVIS